MDNIQQVFNRLEAWGQLPSYQLERRIDIFFSLYIPEALEQKLGKSFSSLLVPEFPFLKKLADKKIKNYQSFRIDYLALDTYGETAILLELKTTNKSRNKTQDTYLQAAQKKEFKHLLKGVIESFKHADADGRVKYFELLKLLEELEQIRIPDNMKEIMARKNKTGLKVTADSIEIVSRIKNTKVIYLQPQGNRPGIINFAEFKTVVDKHRDKLSRNFSRILEHQAG
ncbi:MAG: hypothetical protein HQK83_05730 [Fibrobacteria bacterium]|nr:hypothetical protein [Fibrobacteria bacterium]